MTYKYQKETNQTKQKRALEVVQPRRQVPSCSFFGTVASSQRVDLTKRMRSLAQPTKGSTMTPDCMTSCGRPPLKQGLNRIQKNTYVIQRPIKCLGELMSQSVSPVTYHLYMLAISMATGPSYCK